MSEFINRLHKVLAFGMLGISPELGLENTNIGHWFRMITNVYS